MPHLARSNPEVPRHKSVASVKQRKNTATTIGAHRENALHSLPDPTWREEVGFAGLTILQRFPCEHVCKRTASVEFCHEPQWSDLTFDPPHQITRFLDLLGAGERAARGHRIRSLSTGRVVATAQCLGGMP